MSHAENGMRAAGAWLAIASVLLMIVFVGHGAIHPDLSEQMRIIAEDTTRWVVVHWIAAAALSLFAVTALIVLTSGTRLTESWWTLSAWAIVPVGALWTVTTAVAEATVIAAASVDNVARFEAWWRFAEGKANGFMFVALAVAVIAGNEARLPRGVTPVWASWVAAVAGACSFLAWPVNMWLGIAPAGLAWVASSLVMSAWTLWFGLGLAAHAGVNVSVPRGAQSKA